MKVGILQFELLIPGSHSLKEKRGIVQSLKQQARRKLNLAISEVEDHDLWQKATLAAVTVGVDVPIVDKTMRSLLALVRHSRNAELGDHQLEIL